MTVPPYATAYVVTIVVAWSADHFNAFVLIQLLEIAIANHGNSRGLHSTAFALIGAIGFLASAVLPPDAYAVSYSTGRAEKMSNVTVAPIWLPNSCSKWQFCLYPSASWLALLQHPFYIGGRFSYCTQHILWCTRPDCRSLDLQV